ncbi:DdlA D-alanine-D-alanine ligase and related ATP-grasp enzymes [Candidatus Nanopelagicaceae bacterium]
MIKETIAIVFGGRSSEHEISCLSAGGVLSAIDRAKYEVVLIGITKKGKWVLVPHSHQLTISAGKMPEVPSDAPAVVADVAGFSVGGKDLKIDLIFPTLHGPYGEDGSIQGLFEIADLPYVGSGVLASAVAMDKSFAKPIFAAHGLKVADGFTVTANQWNLEKSELQQKADALGYPLFVKPARGGSSRGTTKVKSADKLAAAVAEAHRFDPKAMVESAIVGLEIECAVLEIDGVPQASKVGQIKIDSKFEFYDFEAKYLDGATEIVIPADIPESASEAIRAASLDAFTSLGCSGLARVDFFFTNAGEVVINEINTMPGFTATSVFPKMWAATGKGYQEIVQALIDTAKRRNNGVLGN